MAVAFGRNDTGALAWQALTFLQLFSAFHLKRQFFIAHGNADVPTACQLAKEQLFCERSFDIFLDHPRHGARAHLFVAETA